MTIRFDVASVLGVVFITLKLVGAITWSWWWVLAPWWMPLGLVGVVFLMAIGAIAVLDGRDRHRAWRS